MAHPRHLNMQRSESVERVREMLIAMQSDIEIPQPDHADLALSRDLQLQMQTEALAEAVLALHDQANRKSRSAVKTAPTASSKDADNAE